MTHPVSLMSQVIGSCCADTWSQILYSIFSDFPHRFVKRLQPNLDLTERDMLALQVTTQESFATVKWFKDDEEIKITRKRNPRLKIVTQDCHHILAIEKCIGSDRGQYSVATNTETTTCAVNVSGK